jgi:hypothetical protein
MTCHEPRREVDLPLPVEGVEQSGSECLDIGGQTVEKVVVARDARWRHVQIAGEIERIAPCRMLRTASAWRSESAIPIRFTI